jgi:hypothetical protein
MILNLALYLEGNQYIDTTQDLQNKFITRVKANGGTFENYNCLNTTLLGLGGTQNFASKYQRTDLFADESISITQVIQDVKDISKIFTDFSKTFTIPATAENNRLFKHYYNYDIDNGFDARIKINAYIEINAVRFNSGKVKLEGVDLKDNKPYAYRITYFGNTVNLKDLIGEDKLNALDLSAYNLTYNSSTVLSKLQANPTSTDVVAPFISHTNRYYYDSSSGHGEDVHNLYYQGGGGHNHGLLWSDLKYAIRLNNIIQAIATKYGLTFSTDFFNSSNLDYYNLFMWLHRAKGDVQGVDSGINPPEIINYWSGTGVRSSFISANTLQVVENYDGGAYYLQTGTSSTSDYKISVYKNGELFYQSNTLNNNAQLDFSNFGVGDYTFFIQSQSIITIDVYLTLLFNDIDSFGQYFTNSDTYNTGDFNTNNTFIFDIAQQIPEIKVIDFLTGIFKMFNLTAYLENDIVVVKTLNDYYATSNVYDITKYISTDTKAVNVALPYKQIEFGYEDTKELLALKHNQQFNYEWGKELYNESPEIDGEIYKVTLPFSHFKYERLFDINGGIQKNIQWGYSATDNFNAATGHYEAALCKPLLFYPILQTGISMSFKPTVSTHQEITSYILPSNSRSLSSSTSTHNINFKAELNEWTATNNFTGTLFDLYYKNYIMHVFNPKNRLTILKAYLPLSVLLNFKLNDRMKINDRLFIINKITTNLTTGESNFELLNEL